MRLLQHFGSAQQIFRLSRIELEQSQLLKNGAISKILDFPQDNFLKKEYNLITQGQVSLLRYNDADYPLCLKEISDAPILLYIRGEIPKEDMPSLSIVGSRCASIYGISIAAKFAAQFAEMGICVVSGLARGIDTSSHQGALRMGGKTVAVLGCGLTHIYPPENRRLFHQIVENGAVISEFPMTTRPAPYHFPRRNRIVSGLSLGVLVVEAAERSGALITADFALDQGREVFAIPGKVDTPTSMGTNKLIKQGAMMVTSAQDCVDALTDQINRLKGIKLGSAPERNKHEVVRGGPHRPAISYEEQAVFDLIKDIPLHIDECQMSAPVSVSLFHSALLSLELKGYVQRLPGNRIQKK